MNKQRFAFFAEALAEAALADADEADDAEEAADAPAERTKRGTASFKIR